MSCPYRKFFNGLGCVSIVSNRVTRIVSREFFRVSALTFFISHGSSTQDTIAGSRNLNSISLQGVMFFSRLRSDLRIAYAVDENIGQLCPFINILDP